MKQTLLLLLLAVPLGIYAQGKYNSEAPFYRLNEISIPKEKKSKQKQYSTRRLHKQNKGFGNKIKLKLALRVEGFSLNTRNNYLLDIRGDEVFYNDAQVGLYEARTLNEKYQNIAYLQQNETSFWSSNELPETYLYESFLKQKVLGGNLEWRFIRNDRMGPPQGFYINTGLIMHNTPVNGLGFTEKEWLFPVGFGFIIPGNEKLRVEITTNAVVGTKSSLGVKFDFSFVYQNIVKFGPAFMYLQNTQHSKNQASGLGLHLGVIFPKIKSNKRR